MRKSINVNWPNLHTEWNSRITNGNLTWMWKTQFEYFYVRTSKIVDSQHNRKKSEITQIISVNLWILKTKKGDENQKNIILEVIRNTFCVFNHFKTI